MAGKRGFLAELRRRHVWRVAVAYAVVGWLLVQVATQAFPALHMPEWTASIVVILVVLGFPLVVVLAWAFEITPEGIRRTEPAQSPEARDPREAHQVARKLNAVIMAGLVLAVAVLAWGLYVMHPAATSARATAEPSGADAAVAVDPARSMAAPPTAAVPLAATASIPARSVAVLPFENLSDDRKNEYFVAGIQDLILTKLADVGELKVISRTSTMQYKSRPGNLKKVATELGVASILQGSVQKQGKQVLINVQLVDARTDTHLWAETYQRTLDNIFGVEGEVAEKIASALHAKLSPTQSANLTAAPTTNPAAYDLFLRAEFHTTRGQLSGDLASFEAAIPLYRKVIAEDPAFALAWARLSISEGAIAWFGGMSTDASRLVEQAHADAEQAVRMAPDLAAAHVALGFSYYHGRLDYAAALRALDRALALSPNDAEALAARGYVQRRQGHYEEAIASLMQALARDPRSSKLTVEIAYTWMGLSRYAEAQAWQQRTLALDRGALSARVQYADAIVFTTGDIPRALATLQGDAALLKFQRVYLLTLQRDFGAAIELLENIPAAPDNFFGNTMFRFRTLLLADLYRLAGDPDKARPLYAQGLSEARDQLSRRRGIALAFVWHGIAIAQLGLGDRAKGLEAIARAQAIVAESNEHVFGPALTQFSAGLYAQARRPDLAVPLLARALAAPGIGIAYSPVMLWLDPWWDPIRTDPGFQALLRQYAQYKPAIIPVALPTPTSPM